MSILSTSNISKSYGSIQALKSVSLVIPKGCTYGILGPNGSGKTTLLGIITDVLKPTSGSYAFYNESSNHSSIRKQIGTLLETPNFYPYLTAVQNLTIAAKIKEQKADDIDMVLKRVGLYERRNSKFSSYSLGMKQRLAIASTLLGNPNVLIFDEPTNGLDPEGIAEIRELIKRLASDGKTIIMASHLLDEVEKVCTHVAILKKGSLLASGKVSELLVKEDIVQLSASNLSKLEAALKQWNGGYTKMQQNNDCIELHFANSEGKMEEVNSYCFSQQLVLNKLVLKKKSLESAFFEITKEIGS